MCLQTSSLRKYTIDDFLPTWLNIFQDVTRSAWENEWKTAGDSSVPCCGCFLTLLVKSNDSISFLQSQTQVTYSVNFYFSQHTRETCTVREIAYCLREKVIAFAGRQQCTCYMLKQNCHFHCKYAFMWSGVYQHLNWELEMWRLLLCVTHFCSFFTKKMKYTYACVSVSCFLSESLHVILNKKKKSTMVVNKMCSLSKTEEVIEQQLSLEHWSIHEWYDHQYVAAFFYTCTDSSVKVCTCVNTHNFKSSKPPHI